MPSAKSWDWKNASGNWPENKAMRFLRAAYRGLRLPNRWIWRAYSKTNTMANAKDVTPQPLPTSQAEAAKTIIGLIDELCGPMLDELQTASQNSMARFNIKYNSAPVAGILLPHLSVVKNRAQFLALRSASYLALGETNKAFEDLRLILYLSDSFKGEPFVISHLVRMACRSFALAVAWQGMADHRWSDAQLRLLQSGFLADNLPLGRLSCFAGRTGRFGPADPSAPHPRRRC